MLHVCDHHPVYDLKSPSCNSGFNDAYVTKAYVDERGGDGIRIAPLSDVYIVPSRARR